MQASRAEANQRVLVRKSLHQLTEHNAETNGMYLEPVITLQKFTAKWASYTAGLSEEELADLSEARAKLEHYKKIYEIFEYCTELNELMYVIESQISTNNPSYPFNIYRQSSSTKCSNMLGDIEKMLAAYYALIDDCQDYPEWQ